MASHSGESEAGSDVDLGGPMVRGTPVARPGGATKLNKVNRQLELEAARLTSVTGAKDE